MKNQEELSTFISTKIKDMGLNNAFDEQMMNELKKSILKKIEEENKLVEEINLEKQPETDQNTIISIEKDSNYIPSLPSFLDKIEPEKFIVFDRNELSVGGENLSNRSFRLVSNPDNKKSIHNSWTEDGKKRAEVYIAKLIKIGEINFDYTNGISQYIENIQEEPNVNNFGFQIEPFEKDVPIKIIDHDLESESESEINSELENKIKTYIKDLIQQKNTNNIVNSSINESNINNSDLKIREIFTNDKKYMKIDTPEELKESVKTGKGKAILKTKNEEVQVWVLEGKEYFLPTNIISNIKCHIIK